MEPHSPRSDSEDNSCRLLLCYSPPWARRLATRKMFTFCYGMLNIVQGMLFFYIVGSLTTIESHFQLPSETFGLVLSVGEVACILTSVVVGIIIDNKTHRPHSLGICFLLIGIGNNLFALPYYIYGSPIPLDNTINGTSAHTLCIESSTLNKDCVTALLAPPGSSQWAVGSIFLLAWSTANIGSNAMFIIGTVFLDDNVENKNSPMYLSLMCSIRTIGPIFGSFLSTFCLATYINPTETPWFDNRDSRWVGAWWLGYVTMGWLAIMCGLLIAQFPRRLPTEELTPALKMEMEQKDSVTDVDKNPQEGKKTSIYEYCKEKIPGVRRILCNFMLWIRVLSENFTLSGVEGFMLYMPKYLEHEFHISASEASIWTGSAFLFPCVVGNLVVGYLAQRFQPTTRQFAAALVAAKTIQAITVVVLPALQCENTVILGSGSPNPACDEVVCDCSKAIFSPICGADGNSYYSACHAGCESFNDLGELDSYLTNCSCISNGGLAFAKTCEIECPQKVGYLLLVAISKFCFSVDVVAGTLFLLRCVEPRDKTLATGFLCTFLGIFTFSTCPILFSAIVDSTCEVWGEQCGRTGACNVYDMDALRSRIHFLPAAFLFFAAFWDGMFWWKSKDKVDLFQDEPRDKVPAEMPAAITDDTTYVGPHVA